MPTPASNPCTGCDVTRFPASAFRVRSRWHLRNEEARQSGSREGRGANGGWTGGLDRFCRSVLVLRNIMARDGMRAGNEPFSRCREDCRCWRPPRFPPVPRASAAARGSARRCARRGVEVVAGRDIQLAQGLLHALLEYAAHALPGLSGTRLARPMAASRLWRRPSRRPAAPLDGVAPSSTWRPSSASCSKNRLPSLCARARPRFRQARPGGRCRPFLGRCARPAPAGRQRCPRRGCGGDLHSYPVLAWGHRGSVECRAISRRETAGQSRRSPSTRRISLSTLAAQGRKQEAQVGGHADLLWQQFDLGRSGRGLPGARHRLPQVPETPNLSCSCAAIASTMERASSVLRVCG